MQHKQELLDEVNLLDNATAQMNLNRDTHIRLGMASNKLRQFIEKAFEPVATPTEPKPPK
jgi:hypothetical protein